METIQQTIKRIGYVEGLYDAIDELHKQRGFDFVDSLLHNYGIGYQTSINYGGVSGYFRRHFVDKTKTFIFDHAFPLNLPS